MSTDKRMKVKDLAAELNIDPKNLLTQAKEMGIASAKVAGSSLSEQEAVRLREHFAPPVKSEDVIVRRRRVAKEAPAATAAEEIPAESGPEGRTGDAPAQAVEAAPEEAKETPAPRRKKPAGARVITRPGEERKAPAQEEAAAVSVEPAPVEPAKEPVEPEAAVVAEEPAKPTDEGKAKVVRPVVRANVSAEPERTADGQAVSSAPLLAPRPEREESEGALFDDADSAEDTSRGRQTSQVRVISRPEAGASRPAPSRTPGRTPGRPPAGRGADSRPPRPAGTGDRPARPSGSRPGGPGGAPRYPSAPPATPAQPFAPASDSGDRGKKRQKGRRTVDFAGDADARRSSGGRSAEEDSGWTRGARRRPKGRQKEQAPPGGTQPQKAVKRKIKVDEFIRVGDLAHQMGVKSGEIIKVLFALGVMATINQSLDIETATLVAAEFNYEVEKVGFSEEDVLQGLQQEDNEPENLVTRPPVVTIMGHVDHGKTSLLDAIRKSSVVKGEAGGITQHIGAYHVATKKGEIVFLDTPGHEAFTAMRARGAEVTDIVVLVVAADDGVMEQTREAINHAKAAGVPIMVAVNKIDKPEANPDRVKRELAEQGLVAEDWGGDVTFSLVSAKTREGLDDLMELLALQAEILELKADPTKPAKGHIVEAKLDKGRGALGTVLIQNGTLRVGDTFVCGVHSGRVRAMFDDQGKKVKSAGPSMPVEVQGFEGVPEAGEEFLSLQDEKMARRIAEARALKQRERELARESKITLETFLSRRADRVEALVLNLVVKADVRGSLEAIVDALKKLSTDRVRIEVIHGGTGAISESDVLLATASNAIIIGFNVRPTPKTKELAEVENVDIRYYDIIYKLVEEIHSAMEGLLAPVEKEVFMGSAEVRDTFSVPKVGVVAGCHISEGKIVRNAHARLLRDGVVVYTGKIGSLRRFKDDVREVQKGYECGIGLENYNDIKAGDVIEAFEIVEEAAKL